MDVVSTLSMNRFGQSLDTTLANNINMDTPTYVVGLKFNFPFYTNTIWSIIEGYQIEKKTAKLKYDQKVFDAKKEWLDLFQKLQETQKKLKLTKTIYTLQTKKLSEETQKYQYGRSTLVQVINADQDVSNAELNLKRVEASLLMDSAQLILYKGDN